MCFVINIPKFIHNMPNCEFTKEDIKKLMQAPSDEVVVSKIGDHVSENKLLSNDKEVQKHKQPVYLASNLFSKNSKIE